MQNKFNIHVRLFQIKIKSARNTCEIKKIIKGLISTFKNKSKMLVYKLPHMHSFCFFLYLIPSYAFIYKPKLCKWRAMNFCCILYIRVDKALIKSTLPHFI